MRHPTAQTPDYPTLEPAPDLPQGALFGLNRQIALEGHHDPYNGFMVEGVEKWGRPQGQRLTRILVSGAPFEGVPPDETALSGLHVLFETESGDRFGVNRCRSSYKPVPHDGVFVSDLLGRAWFCGVKVGTEDPPTVLTGQERLRPVPANAAPLLRDTALGGANLADLLPAAGRFLLGTQGEALGAMGGIRPVDPALLTRITARVDILVAREERLRAIAERHLGEGALDGLLLGRDFPITDGLIPAYHAFEARKAFDKALFSVTRGLLEEFRVAGLLEPCPNNGPRGVDSLEVWNRWLDGAYDPPPEDRNREDRYGERSLSEAPAFKTVWNCVVRAVVDAERRVWERDHPGEAYPSGETRKTALERADVDAALRDARTRIITAYAEEETIDNIGFIELRGRQTGDALVLQNSFLTPVLCAIPRDYGSELAPLPSLETPKSVRHLELSMPSGVLCMADWFRIDGFKEGLQALLGGDDHYEINYATGLDTRARDYFEKAGLLTSSTP